MNLDQAQLINSQLSTDALVIDVGGGMAPFDRADWIIDAIDYDQRGMLLKHQTTPTAPRISRDKWVRFDICSRQPWPFPDKQFDFAVCSHVLEDVRDPIWVCSEISRIAKAGYVELPSRVVEQSKGVEHPRFAGYYHHRWLVTVRDGGLEFRHKPHVLHVVSKAIVAHVGLGRQINPQHAITTLFWRDELVCREVLEFNEQSVIDELCQFSKSAQLLPELTVPLRLPIGKRLRGAMYRLRQAWS